MESGLVVRGKMFIDATYEGDLMAKAGVSYHVGREANSVYGETLNGVQPLLRQAPVQGQGRSVRHARRSGRAACCRASTPALPARTATGDKRVQAYNFRMCLTDVPENRVPFPKPAGYDPLRYELLPADNFEAGAVGRPGQPDR